MEQSKHLSTEFGNRITINRTNILPMCVVSNFGASAMNGLKLSEMHFARSKNKFFSLIGSIMSFVSPFTFRGAIAMLLQYIS